MPVCLVQIADDLNLSNTLAGSFGLITSAQALFMLLLAGVLAAKWGKLRLLRLSMLIAGAGMAVFTQADGYATVLLALLIIGAGTGLIEALVTPLVEDLHPGDDGHQQNILHAFWPLGVIVSTLAIGELLTRGVPWRWVYAGLAMITAAATLIYPSGKIVKQIRFPRSRADFSHAKQILSLPRFQALGVALFFAGGAEGGFTFWTANYIQTSFNTEPRAGAIGIALFAVGIMGGRLICAKLAKRFSLRTVLIASAALAFGLTLGFPFIQTLPALFVMITLIGFAIASYWPSLQTHSTRVLKADPTMVMILLSCCGLPGFTSSVFIMGYLSDTTSLQWAFAAVPAYLLGLLFIMIIEARLKTSAP